MSTTRLQRHVRQIAAHNVDGHLYLGDRLCERLKSAVIDVLEGGMYYSPSIAAARATADHLNGRILPRLNAYHREVLRDMARHRTPGQIASRLDRTTHAIYQVQAYLRDLFGVSTNSALVERALAWGVVTSNI